MIDAKTKENVWTLHLSKKMSKTAISKQLGISRPKVIEILKDESYKNLRLIDVVKEIEVKHTESLINILKKDSRLPATVNKILNAINQDEVIDAMIAKGDLKQLMTVFGVLSDKHFGSKRVEQEERRLAIQDRMAVLKERELNARIENPDAFSTVTILNDSKTITDWYKENGTEQEYHKN